jgi:hypothetical protein
MAADEFDAVRSEPDPLRRGRRATELLTHYQQRAAELARLRRAAIEQAHRDQGLSYTEIATTLGLTKGRITQIRATAPSPERAFFGVGPVAVAIPLREGFAERERMLMSAEDMATADQIEAILASHALASERVTLRSDATKLPDGDCVVICGPKSAPIAAQLMAEDPRLGMAQDGQWWSIIDKTTGRKHPSPGDGPHGINGDIAYMSRRQIDGRIAVHIAGIHSVGSLGMAHYLTGHLAELYADLGDDPFSLAATCTFDDLTITNSKLVLGPYRW